MMKYLEVFEIKTPHVEICEMNMEQYLFKKIKALIMFMRKQQWLKTSKEFNKRG